MPIQDLPDNYAYTGSGIFYSTWSAIIFPSCTPHIARCQGMTLDGADWLLPALYNVARYKDLQIVHIICLPVHAPG